jgi:hypothetical protein
MALFKQDKKLSDIPAPPKADFPISKPNFDDDFPRYTPSIGDFNMEEKRKFPVVMPKKMVMPESNEKKSGPIFIKIDKYEEAIDNINSVKDKIREIESLIDNLRKLKKEEDNSLDEWKSSLNQIKEKLLIVDKNLFEK